MIVIKDLSERALKELKANIGALCYNVVEMGAPDTYKVTLNERARISYKAGGAHVFIEYQDRNCILDLNDFATMEIL